MTFLRRLYYYFKFIRPLAFLGIFITFICASIIAINSSNNVNYDIIKIFLGALSAGFLASASHTLNNIFDIEIDRINKPDRLLPSNKISLKEAWVLTILLFFLPLSISFNISFQLFSIILIISLFSLIYSTPPLRTKKILFLENLTIAIPRGLLIFLAGWSIIKSIFGITPWFIGSISMLYLFGATSTKDFKDVKGDKQNNCNTLPVRYGIKKTIRLITPFFIFPFLLISVGVYLNILKITTLPLTLLLFYGIFITKTMKKEPNRLTKFENNHISWMHTYVLYMIIQIGFGIAYVI